MSSVRPDLPRRRFRMDHTDRTTAPFPDRLGETMDIAVLVKQVPDTYAERRMDTSDWTLDRDASDAVIDEIDAKAVEVALQLTELHGGEVTVVTMGPARATETLRKALSMGAHKAVHVLDGAIAGSCALQTSQVLAAALRGVGADLVVAGNEATDGRTGSVPAMVAERLGLPAVTSVRTLTVDGSTLTAERVVESGFSEITSPLPAVVSVNEKIAEPRYPNFKGIMAAKSKPVTTLSASDLGLDPGQLGLAAASTQIVSGEPRPPKEAGTTVTDDGTAGRQLADFLAGEHLL